MKMKKFGSKIAWFIILLCFSNSIFSQSYIPGNVYLDSTGYVEYRAGNLPIIISAPHGGSLEPSSIPDRTCAGCVMVKDSWTQTISEGMYDEIFDKTGCYPHVIINLLHRKKFDANRDIGDAADGNPKVEQAWKAYHEFINSAKTQVASDYGRGLFLDIHGHGHSIQRIELGYLLSKSELQLPDSSLNATILIEESGIKQLIGDNIQNHSHTELLKGPNSFGTLLAKKGFPSVPSSADPFAQGNEPYFSGGYNTQRHGSRDTALGIDAIQVELNQQIRFNDSTRLVLIDSLAQTAMQYYDLHFNNQFLGNYCALILGHFTPSIDNNSISLYPNPTTEHFVLSPNLASLQVLIYNNQGQKVLSKKVKPNEKIDVRELSKGLYIVQVLSQEKLLEVIKLAVR